MIDAYRAGVPGNGRQFPDGSKTAKIEWNPSQNGEAPLYEAHVVKRDLLCVANGVSDETGIGLAASVRRFAAPPCIRALHRGGLTHVPRSWANARPGGWNPSF